MAEETKKRSLFDIGDDLIALEQLIDERDGDISDPEVEAAITAWMAELAQDKGRKVDGYINLIRKWEAEMAAAKAEAEQYMTAAQVRENRVKRLKGMLASWMLAMQCQRIETPTGRTVAMQNNGGVDPMDVDDVTVMAVINSVKAVIGPMPEFAADKALVEILPYLKVVRIELDTKAVREALKAGKTLSFAKLLPKGQHLRIR